MADSTEPRPAFELPIAPTRLTEQAPNGWLVLDHHGAIFFVNQEAEQMFGYERQELIGGARVILKVPVGGGRPG